ncbi:MAG: mechanosensitive ion channel family protein, partial [Saprospiraceae bacterium]
MGDFFTRIGDFLNFGWDIGTWALNVRMLLFSVLLIVFGFVFMKFILKWILQLLESKKALKEKDKRKVKRNLLSISVLGILIGLLNILQLDAVLYETSIIYGSVKLRISFILIAVIIILLARLFDWFVSGAIGRYYDKRDELGEQNKYTPEKQQKDPRNSVNKTIQYVVYLVAVIIILRTFNINHEFYTLKDGGHFTISSIIEAILCLFIARLVIWMATNIVLHTYYKRSSVDIGSQYAINQIFSYIVYVLAVIFALKSLQFDLNLLLTGAAALLVGIGLGLQNLFSDLVSGIILLFEGTIELGDIVEVDGIVGTVVKIGIRTSLVQVR